MAPTTKTAKSNKCKKAGRKRNTFKAGLEDPAYWEARLKKMGLSMEAGYDTHRILYGLDVAVDYTGRCLYVPPQRESSESGPCTSPF